MTESMSNSLSFNDYLSAHKKEMLPNGTVPLNPGSFDASILLSNDIMPADMITKDKPNGTLFGLGFGGVFGMLDYFEDKKPDQILLFDVTPEPIEIGKQLIETMKKHSDFRHFINEASMSHFTLPEGERILHHTIRLYRMRSETPTTFALRHVRRNYETIHQLAVEGKIHIGYGDIFAPATTEAINNFKIPDKRHLLYVTDAPQFDLDHVDNIKGALENTWFVDTTTPYNDKKGAGITMCRATYGELPVYDEEYRSYLR